MTTQNENDIYDRKFIVKEFFFLLFIAFSDTIRDFDKNESKRQTNANNDEWLIDYYVSRVDFTAGRTGITLLRAVKLLRSGGGVLLSQKK